MRPLDPTTAYAASVVEGKVPSCRYVRLACERHIKDLARKDIAFDERAALRFFKYSESLKHYKGPYRGKQILLNPWQKFIEGCRYGWKRGRTTAASALWRFNINYTEVPRKNGKTTISAAGASYDCGFMEDTGAEVYCMATKEDQAKLLFNDINAYISKSPELSEMFEVLQGKNTIYSVGSARTSFVRPLGGDSKTLDGLNPFSAYADELHAWPKPDLWYVMEDGFGARRNWHMNSITTAGNNRMGICWDQRNHIINILEGRIESDNHFGIIYTVDEENYDQWRDPRQWYIANPNLETGKELSYMEEKCRMAEQMPSSLNAFLNKQLNIWTDVAEAWLQVEQWKRCAGSFDETLLKGKRCFVGVDLAKVNDQSAVAYVFPKQTGLDKEYWFVDYYMPSEALRQKSERDGVPYNLWADQGHLFITQGRTTDYSFIRRDINLRAKDFRVMKIKFDRHFAGELINDLTNDGFEIDLIGMGFMDMTHPTGEVERLIVAGEAVHPDNPILNWNASNVVIKKDSAGNIKPDKELSIRKIDGIVAIIIAKGHEDDEKIGPSVYETRGVISIGGLEQPRERVGK
jgi:phage terminase large subunit-like protein